MKIFSCHMLLHYKDVWHSGACTPVQWPACKQVRVGTAVGDKNETEKHGLNEWPARYIVMWGVRSSHFSPCSFALFLFLGSCASTCPVTNFTTLVVNSITQCPEGAASLQFFGNAYASKLCWQKIWRETEHYIWSSHFSSRTKEKNSHRLSFVPAAVQLWVKLSCFSFHCSGLKIRGSISYWLAFGYALQNNKL